MHKRAELVEVTKGCGRRFAVQKSSENELPEGGEVGGLQAVLARDAADEVSQRWQGGCLMQLQIPQIQHLQMLGPGCIWRRRKAAWLPGGAKQPSSGSRVPFV